MYLIVTPSLELNALIRIQRTPAQSLTLSQSYQTSLIFNPNFVSQVSFPVLLLDKKFPHCNWVDCYITEFINKQSFFFPISFSTIIKNVVCLRLIRSFLSFKQDVTFVVDGGKSFHN